VQTDSHVAAAAPSSSPSSLDWRPCPVTSRGQVPWRPPPKGRAREGGPRSSPRCVCPGAYAAFQPGELVVPLGHDHLPRFVEPVGYRWDRRVVLLAVLVAVSPDESKVIVEDLARRVAESKRLIAHRPEVHRVFDHLEKGV